MAESRSSTYTFKGRDGQRLTIDISMSETSQPNPVVLVHIHGGFLIIGEKTTFSPHWLINACRMRGWRYATPSYRLLPEASGLETLCDILDAVQWIHDNISARIILAGSSAGGCLALAAAAHPKCPRPLCVLSIYGMLDPASQRYIHPGKGLRGPVDNLEEKVADIKRATASRQTIVSYPFPADPGTDKRFSWISAVHEAGIYPDILTRTPGLALRIATHGVSEIPKEFWSLFPVSFGLEPGFPPVILLHGADDVLVDIDQSIMVFDKLKAQGVGVHLVITEGQGHGFDAKQFIDLDSEIFPKGEEAMVGDLKKVIGLLENLITE